MINDTWMGTGGLGGLGGLGNGAFGDKGIWELMDWGMGDWEDWRIEGLGDCGIRGPTFFKVQKI